MGNRRVVHTDDRGDVAVLMPFTEVHGGSLAGP
jgi:hypothetical protein